MIRKAHFIPFLNIFLLSLQFSVAQDVRKEGKYWVGQFEKILKMEPGGNIHFNNVRGDITINSWDRDEVRIHEIKRMDIFSKDEAMTALRLSESACKLTDNTLTIGGEPFNRKWIQSTFEVFVPYKFNCDLETQGGDVSAFKIEGEVKVLSGGGDISIEEIDGPVNAKTGGGDVDISNITQEVYVKTGGGDVNIEAIKGSVHISSGGGDISAVNVTNQLNITTGGGDVDVNEITGELSAQTGGGDIDISEVTGNVMTQTGGGDIDISEIEGELNVQTGGGDIDIGEVTGNVSTQTGGGDVCLSEIRGTIEANSGGGDIEATEIHGSAFANSGGGDIELIEVFGAVEAKSANGDIKAVISYKESQMDYHVNIETKQGNIELVIPENIPATIEATITANHREWDDYHIISDFPLTISTKKLMNGHQTIKGTGDINHGGNKIILKTSGGDITIQK